MDVHPLSARAVAVAALALSACGSEEPTMYRDLPSAEVASYALPLTHQLDLLFVMDDSPNDVQGYLATAIPTFLDHLDAAAGGPPNLHVGLVTSDLGTTGTDDPTPGPPIGQIGSGGCAGAGKDGLLQTSSAPVTDRYVVDDGSMKNYTGELAAVLEQMIKVGAGGCGFEQPLAAFDRALHNPGNAGFLRPTADLAVVFVQDEDDCSFRRPALLGPETPELGPQQSFRCTRFGLVCDEDLNEVGEKHRCHAKEDSPLLTGVAHYIEALRGAAVRTPTVAAIAGIPTVAVERRAPPGGGTSILALTHSCSYTGLMGLEVADPAVRIADTLHGLGGHGQFETACQIDLAPAASRIANRIAGAFGVVCLDTAVLRDSSTDPGVQPLCTADIDGEPVAVEIITDATLCDAMPGNLRAVVHAEPGASGTVHVRCDVPG